MNRTIFEIIGDRYLDTQHDPEYIEELETELKKRNIVGVKRLACEYIAASGLWWNLFWWEWGTLDLKDVKIGWIQNTVLFAILGIAGFYFGSFSVGFGVIIVVHSITLGIGLSLRAGTKLTRR